jgi:RNA polymerase sigma-70 factor, ECF subfamily
MAFVYVKNENDALDVVQETAYRAFLKIDTLKSPEYFKTWVIRIAINCALDLMKQNNKVVPLKQDYEDIWGTEEEDIPLTLTLQDLLDSLEQEEKSVILLRFYQGHTLKEIAEILNIPLGTAKSILYRSIKKVRHEYWRGDGTNE